VSSVAARTSEIVQTGVATARHREEWQRHVHLPLPFQKGR